MTLFSVVFTLSSGFYLKKPRADNRGVKLTRGTDFSTDTGKLLGHMTNLVGQE